MSKGLGGRPTPSEDTKEVKIMGDLAVRRVRTESCACGVRRGSHGGEYSISVKVRRQEKGERGTGRMIGWVRDG